MSADDVQDRHERAVGQTFIDWYNTGHKTGFKLVDRVGEAPNLRFRDGDRELRAEVSTAYYDAVDAKIKWMHAEKVRDAPNVWRGTDLESALIRNIGSEIADKCSKEYGPGCVLLISVRPTVTTATMMGEVLKELVVPQRNPFDGVYLIGHLVPAKRIGNSELQVRRLA